MAVATCPRCGTARPAAAAWTDVCPACLLEKALALDEEWCPYQVLAPMAEGRRGVTYLAQALTGARGYVALKIFTAELDGESAVQRHERWRPSLEAVQHPHVRAVTDVGLTSDQRLYVASEYIVGSTLAIPEIVGSLRPDARLEVAHQLASAVDAIHAAGLAHLGLEPARVKFSTTKVATAIVLGLGIRLVVDGAKVQREPDLMALADLIRGVGVPLPERDFESAAAVGEAIRESASS